MERFARLLAGFLLSLAAIIILWAVYLVRQFLPLLGLFALASSIVLVGMGLTLAVSFTLKHWHKPEVIHLEQWGAYTYRHGKTVALAPINAIAPPRVVAELAMPKLPRLAELIMDGSLIKAEAGMMLMFQGFRQDASIRYGEWPGVIAVSGMQNVGKSVTIMTLVIIALLQGAKVVVCDTHYRKQRSLTRKIEALRNFIEFANTEEEVRKRTEEFSLELANRKNGSEPFPYILVYDETASLMRSDIAGDITNTLEEASQEGHGFNMHLILAVHDFSQDGLGDARIRSFFNWIYCHRMEAGQAKFIQAFNTRKMKSQIAALPRGHSIAKDEVNECEYLILPNGDNRDAMIANKKLLELRGPTIPTLTEIPRFRSENDGFIRAENADFTPETEPLRIAAPVETIDFRTYEGRKARIKRLRSKNFLQGEILQAVYQVKPGATEAYQQALKEYKQILVELAAEESVHV